MGGRGGPGGADMGRGPGGPQRPGPPPGPPPDADKKDGAGAAADAGKEEDKKEEAASPVAASKPALSEEEMRKKSKSMVEEWYAVKDKKEVAECINELAAPAFLPQMVEVWVVDALESKGRDWVALRELCAHCHSEGLLPTAALVGGARRVFDAMEDLMIDVPKAPKLVGEFYAHLVKGGWVALGAVLQELLAARHPEAEEGEPSFVDGPDGIVVAAALLKAVGEVAGAGALAEQWAAAGLQLTAFLPEDEREAEGALDEAIKQHKLECLYPLRDAEGHLKDSLAAGAGAAELQAWVDEHVDAAVVGTPAFATLLVRLVLEHACEGLSLEEDALKADEIERVTHKETGLWKLLRKVVGENQAVHLECVFEVQLFCHKQGHPKGLMTRLLKDMYYTDVLSEEAYTKWRDDNARNDTVPGKIKATFEVTQFLDWLANAEEEESDED
mmetsp:Transcript_19607/g.62386  ORF Transcript_19607/g.62386 Transcript_19607/m.62386 type:complete len:444 (+) Transcript_19607:3-1334(+)